MEKTSKQKKLEEIRSYKSALNLKISKLEDLPEVREYIETLEELEYTSRLEKYAYKESRCEEFDNCKHLLITTLIKPEGDTHFRGCIKCGLDESAITRIGLPELSDEDKIMYDYLTGDGIFSFDSDEGNVDFDRSDVLCHLPVAKAIYKKIKDKKPELDDITAFIYFERALAHIRMHEVNIDRENSRIKRLSLNDEDALWYSNDVRYGK